MSKQTSFMPSSSKHRPASALKSSRRQQQPPTPPGATSIFSNASEWLSQKVVTLMSISGYNNASKAEEGEKKISERGKPAYNAPSLEMLLSFGSSAGSDLLQALDLKKNDAEFFDVAQEILVKAKSYSGAPPSQFQKSVDRFIAVLLKSKGIEPSEFVEALQYRVEKLPRVGDPSNQSRLNTVTHSVASLLNVRPASSEMQEPQTAKLKSWSSDLESLKSFSPLAFVDDKLSSPPPPPSEPPAPLFDYPPFSNSNNNLYNQSPPESFIHQHSTNPLQEHQGQQYFLQQPLPSTFKPETEPSYRQFGAALVDPAHHSNRIFSFACSPSQQEQLNREQLPHNQRHSSNVHSHAPPQFHYRQNQQQQQWNDEPDYVFNNNIMNNDATNSANNLGAGAFDEAQETFNSASQQIQQLLSQERQKIMLEIDNVMELLSRSSHDSVLYSRYKNRLFKLQHRLDSLHDEAVNLQSINASEERQNIMLEIDTVMELLSKTAHDPYLYSRYKKRLLKLQHKLESLHDDVIVGNIDLSETNSIASAASNSSPIKAIDKEIALSATIPIVPARVIGGRSKKAERMPAATTKKLIANEEEKTHKTYYTPPVVVSPTAEVVLASTYHELADEGAMQILHSQGMSSQERGTTPSKKDKEPYIKKIKFIQVRAPITMPEGYTFEAKVGEKVLMVKVPKGGAKKGQIFDHVIEEETQMYIPLGRWRNPLYGFFAYGIGHPMCWNGCLCPHVALSQVMARVHLNACANPVLNVKARTNAISVLFASIAVIALHSILISIPFQSGGIAIILMQVIPLVVLDLILIVYFFVLLVKTRSFVRQMYKIDGSPCEDATTSALFTSCTIIQMGHHTADYETYNGVCCSSTGLPPLLQALSPHSLPPPEFKKTFSMC